MMHSQFFRALWEIKGKLYAGESGRKILTSLREQGLGYRTQNFYRDRRIILAAKDTFDKTLDLAPDRDIPDYLHVTASNVLPKKYAYVTRVTADDLKLGITTDWHITVSSDERLSREEILDIARDRGEKYPGDYEIKTVDLEEEYRSM